MTVWDRMMGTYFADQEQIARLRMKNRVAAQDLMSTRSISTDAADLVPSQCDEKIMGGEGTGSSKTVTT